jgi:hypothetical protein
MVPNGATTRGAKDRTNHEKCMQTLASFESLILLLMMTRRP